MSHNEKLTAADVPPIAVKLFPEDYAEVKRIAKSERAPMASVVRRFVGQCIDKSKEEAWVSQNNTAKPTFSMA